MKEAGRLHYPLAHNCARAFRPLDTALRVAVQLKPAHWRIKRKQVHCNMVQYVWPKCTGTPIRRPSGPLLLDSTRHSYGLTDWLAHKFTSSRTSELKGCPSRRLKRQASQGPLSNWAQGLLMETPDGLIPPQTPRARIRPWPGSADHQGLPLFLVAGAGSDATAAFVVLLGIRPRSVGRCRPGAPTHDPQIQPRSLTK